MSEMRHAIVTVILLAALAGCSSESGPENEPATSIDRDYVLALSAANRFLAAWRSRDQDAALPMLSSRLITSKGEKYWREKISGISNPHHEAYEISGGRRLEDGRFAFHVWLHTHYTGFSLEPVRKSKPGRIILIKVAAEQWKVDDVPDL